ncbi:MAG: hypothetical protein CFE25_05630 [Chitinophagaceae bacterium BSSC1]|nr:MAG: hypothetical protein CFE25_05630 [Chitinophagaceae bacterium BSSC1]
MKTRKTIYHLILDKSSSMSDCKEQTVNGFNMQIEAIKSLENEFPEEEITIGLTTFNHIVFNQHFDVLPANFEKLTYLSYQPSGTTALLDAIGNTIKIIEDEYFLSQNGLPTSVVIVIITDGHENSSYNFPLTDIKSNISRLEETGNWTFSFIGATLDAVSVAAKMAIRRSNSYSFDKRNMESEVWTTVTDSLLTYCSNKRDGKENKNLFNKEE